MHLRGYGEGAVAHQLANGGGDARRVRVVPAQQAERVRDCVALAAAIGVGDDHLHVRPGRLQERGSDAAPIGDDGDGIACVRL